MAKKKKNNLGIALVNNFDTQIYGMSRNFARAELWDSDIRKWSVLQEKIFVEVISQINWKGGGNNNIIEISNDDLMQELRWDLGSKSARQMGYNIRKELDFMLRNDAIVVQDVYTKQFYEGHIFVEFEWNSLTTTITINPTLMPHFEKLYHLAKTTQVPFLTFFKPEVMAFKCKYSYPFLMELKSCCKVGGPINHHSLTTRQLKELFGLDESAYMRDYDETRGTYSKFDRANFEKYTIDKAIEEINETCMASVLQQEDGKYYKKTKKRGKVTGYEFQYVVFDVDQMQQRKLKQANVSEN